MLVIGSSPVLLNRARGDYEQRIILPPLLIRVVMVINWPGLFGLSELMPLLYFHFTNMMTCIP